MTAVATEFPGLVAGTWVIDPSHSDVSFTVRHLMVSKVRGQFTRFSGTIRVAEDVLASSAQAEIDVASVDTRDENRDNHLRTSDFFTVEEFPTMTYSSTGVRRDGEGFLVDGELTLRGVTRPVTLQVELNGVHPDPWGGTRAGFSASTVINRKDFGVNWNAPIDGGGTVVGDKVTIALEIQAVLQTD
ncbi:MAG: YceI family protein [Actinomycetes bacterium]